MCDAGVSEVSGIRDTGFSQVSKVSKVYVFWRVFPGLYRDTVLRVIQGYTELSRVYTGFIQGYTRVISQTRVTTFNEGNEGYWILKKS